jgi:hypothetical protein
MDDTWTKHLADILKQRQNEARLFYLCKKFIRDNDIHCVETISQTDHVITNAYDFIADICDIVGFASSDASSDEDSE